MLISPRPSVRAGALILVHLCLLCGVVPVAAETESPDAGEPKEADSREGANFSPTFNLRGFADVQMSATQITEDGVETDSTDFTLGELDLFITARLSDRFSFLAETVFEVEESNDTIVDIERLFVTYSFSDQLRVSLGRRHTPLGYWNESYHHGLFLQPTVERPAALRFEDKGGILPVHSVGIQAAGTVFRGAWAMDYVGGIANGRGYDPHEIQNLGDENSGKATTGKLSFSRTKNAQVRFGPMFYSDTIPSDPDPAGRQGEIDELILGVHFVFQSDDLQVVSEYFDIRHEDRTSGVRADHSAWYAIAIWQRWRWKPYVGYDTWELDPVDTFFAGQPRELERFQGGVRFDINAYSAVKLELRHEDQPGVEKNDLFVQIALTF
jgi:hypothetical protein